MYKNCSGKQAKIQGTFGNFFYSASSLFYKEKYLKGVYDYEN